MFICLFARCISHLFVQEFKALCMSEFGILCPWATSSPWSVPVCPAATGSVERGVGDNRQQGPGHWWWRWDVGGRASVGLYSSPDFSCDLLGKWNAHLWGIGFPPLIFYPQQSSLVGWIEVGWIGPKVILGSSMAEVDLNLGLPLSYCTGSPWVTLCRLATFWS